MNIEELTEEEKVALRKRFDDLVLAVDQTPEPSLPLACVLKVVETFVNVAFGSGKSEIVVLVDGHGAKHHVSAPSGQFHAGELVVMLGANAFAKVSPVFEKWRGRTARKLTFDLGGGMGTFATDSSSASSAMDAKSGSSWRIPSTSRVQISSCSTRSSARTWKRHRKG